MEYTQRKELSDCLVRLASRIEKNETDLSVEDCASLFAICANPARAVQTEKVSRLHTEYKEACNNNAPEDTKRNIVSAWNAAKRDLRVM